MPCLLINDQREHTAIIGLTQTTDASIDLSRWPKGRVDNTHSGHSATVHSTALNTDV